MALRILAVIGMIVGALALHGLALYAIYRITMLIVAVVPLVGRKHEHERWKEMNAGKRPRCDDRRPTRIHNP